MVVWARTPRPRLIFDPRGRPVQHLLQSFRARIDVPVVEDSEQLTAACQRRHALPSGISFGIFSKGIPDQWRQLAFGFHGFKQLFRHLLGAPLARSRALPAGDLVRNVPPYGVVEGTVEFTKLFLLLQDLLHLDRKNDRVHLRVRLELELSLLVGADATAFLHLLVNQQIMSASAVREKRSSKFESINLTPHP